MSWVLDEAMGVRPHLVATLLGLANHADRSGCGSFPSQATLARYARKSARAIRNDLEQLVADGLIERGDQRLVEHLPGDERPVVWDLAMDRNPDSDPSSEWTGSTVPVGTEVPAGSAAAEGPEVQRAGGRKPASDKPTTEPTDEPKNSPSGSSTHARERGTRIPADFAVTDGMRDYARRFATEALGREPNGKFGTWLDRKHLDFVDYWNEKSGAQAVKRDWGRAWQRWMRREIERSAEQKPGSAVALRDDPAEQSPGTQRASAAVEIANRLKQQREAAERDTR